jgi:hypothetical protein
MVPVGVRFNGHGFGLRNLLGKSTKSADVSDDL